MINVDVLFLKKIWGEIMKIFIKAVHIVFLN